LLNEGFGLGFPQAKQACFMLVVCRGHPWFGGGSVKGVGKAKKSMGISEFTHPKLRQNDAYLSEMGC